MRKILLTAAMANVAALALFVAACKAPDGAGSANNATPASAPANTAEAPKAPADIVRRVTPNEVKGMMDRGEALVVDVRGKSDYDNGHIKGSVSLPLGEMSARASELPKDKLIVFYCA